MSDPCFESQWNPRRAGTHDELLANGGLYATLWGVQAGGIEAFSER